MMGQKKMTVFTAIFPCCAGVGLFLEAMFYGRMPFLTPTLVASYDTQGYGTPILTGAYTGTSTLVLTSPTSEG